MKKQTQRPGIGLMLLYLILRSKTNSNIQIHQKIKGKFINTMIKIIDDDKIISPISMNNNLNVFEFVVNLISNNVNIF